MKIVIPLAGKDPDFENKGVFKALFPVCGKPLIQWCTDSLSYPFKEADYELIFIILKEHEEQYHVSEQLCALYGDVHVKILGALTEGAACTVLSVKDQINTDEDLLIYLADLIFECDLKREIENVISSGIKGLIPVFQSNKEKYSYVAIDDNDIAQEVAEKKVISTNATSGFYYFKHGKDFVWAAEEMIKKDLRVRNLFFVAPVYQQLIERGDPIKVTHAAFEFGLGNPEEIEIFEKNKEMPHDRIRIFAHKGLFDRFPENSISALREALDKDYSIEIDVQPTKDGELVIIHDSNLEKGFGNNMVVRESHFEDLRKCNYLNSQEKIATFREVCELFKKYNAAEMGIHLKAPASIGSAKKIIDILLEFTLIDKAFIFDVTKELAQEIKDYNRFIKLGASVADRKGDTLYTLPEVIDFPYFDIIWLDEWVTFYTEDLVKHSLKKTAYAISPELHTLEKHPRAHEGYEKTWEELVSWGIQGICTDHPEALRSLLNTK